MSIDNLKVYGSNGEAGSAMEEVVSQGVARASRARALQKMKVR
jgi:hypothetical protein